MRYSTIQSEIWHDGNFPFLDDDEKLVWFHLVTNPYNNSLGLYIASLEGLAASLRWSAERYRKVSDRLKGYGLLEYDEDRHVVFLPNYLKNNKPLNPNVFKGMLSAWELIPDCPLKLSLFNELGACCAEWGASFSVVFETLREPIGNLSNRFREPIRNKNKNKIMNKNKGKGKKENNVTFANEHDAVVETLEPEKQKAERVKSDVVDKIFEHWQKRLDHPRAKLDAKRRKLILRALKTGYSEADLCMAITGCSLTPFNMGENDRGEKYDSLDLILRNSDKIDRFIRHAESPPIAMSKEQQRLQNNEVVIADWVNRKTTESFSAGCFQL